MWCLKLDSVKGYEVVGYGQKIKKEEKKLQFVFDINMTYPSLEQLFNRKYPKKENISMKALTRSYKK